MRSASPHSTLNRVKLPAKAADPYGVCWPSQGGEHGIVGDKKCNLTSGMTSSVKHELLSFQISIWSHRAGNLIDMEKSETYFRCRNIVAFSK
jgi:hypothetical protein